MPPLVGRQVGGWVGGQTDRQIDRCTGRQVDEWLGIKQVDGGGGGGGVLAGSQASSLPAMYTDISSSQTDNILFHETFCVVCFSPKLGR